MADKNKFGINAKTKDGREVVINADEFAKNYDNYVSSNPGTKVTMYDMNGKEKAVDIAQAKTMYGKGYTYTPDQNNYHKNKILAQKEAQKPKEKSGGVIDWAKGLVGIGDEEKPVAAAKPSQPSITKKQTTTPKVEAKSDVTVGYKPKEIEAPKVDIPTTMSEIDNTLANNENVMQGVRDAKKNAGKFNVYGGGSITEKNKPSAIKDAITGNITRLDEERKYKEAEKYVPEAMREVSGTVGDEINNIMDNLRASAVGDIREQGSSWLGLAQDDVASTYNAERTLNSYLNMENIQKGADSMNISAIGNKILLNKNGGYADWVKRGAKNAGRDEESYIRYVVTPAIRRQFAEQIAKDETDKNKINSYADYLAKQFTSTVSMATMTKDAYLRREAALAEYEQGFHGVKGFLAKTGGIVANVYGDPTVYAGGAAGNFALKGVSAGARMAGTAAAKQLAKKELQNTIVKSSLSKIAEYSPKFAQYIAPKFASTSSEAGAKYAQNLLANLSKPSWYGQKVVQGAIAGVPNFMTMEGTKAAWTQLTIGDDNSGYAVLNAMWNGATVNGEKHGEGAKHGAELGALMSLVGPVGQLGANASRQITRAGMSAFGKAAELGTFMGIDLLEHKDDKDYTFTDSFNNNAPMIIGMHYGMKLMGGPKAFVESAKRTLQQGWDTVRHPIDTFYNAIRNTRQNVVPLTKDEREWLNQQLPGMSIRQYGDIINEKQLMERVAAGDKKALGVLNDYYDTFQGLLTDPNTPWTIKQKLGGGMFGTIESARPLYDHFTMDNGKVMLYDKNNQLVEIKSAESQEEVDAILDMERMRAEHAKVANMYAQLALKGTEEQQELVKGIIKDIAFDMKVGDAKYAPAALIDLINPTRKRFREEDGEIKLNNGAEIEAMTKDFVSLLSVDPSRLTDIEREYVGFLGDDLRRIIANETADVPNPEIHTEIGSHIAETVNFVDDNVPEEQKIDAVNGLYGSIDEAQKRVVKATEGLAKAISEHDDYGEFENLDYKNITPEYVMQLAETTSPAIRDAMQEFVSATNVMTNAQARKEAFIAKQGQNIEEALQTMYSQISYKDGGADNVLSFVDGEGKQWFLRTGAIDEQGRLTGDMVTFVDANGEVKFGKAEDYQDIQLTAQGKDEYLNPVRQMVQEYVTQQYGLNRDAVQSQAEATGNNEIPVKEPENPANEGENIPTGDNLSPEGLQNTGENSTFAEPSQEQSVTSETPTQGTPKAEFPKDSKGKDDYLAEGVTPETALARMREKGLDDTEIAELVDAKLKKSKAPKMSDDEDKYLEAKAKYAREQEIYNGIKAQIEAEKNAVLQEEAQRRAEAEAARVERERIAAEARAQAEEEARKEKEKTAGVPDWLNDKPEDARERGYRMVEGVRYDRQEPIEGVEGRDAEVIFGRGKNDTKQGKMMLASIDDIQESHRGDMPNPLHFIPEAQPKDRTSDASKADTLVNANPANFKPELLTGDGVVYTESNPVVNARGEVIQGNGRLMTMREVYNNHESAKMYKGYLKAHAEEFGLKAEDVDKIEKPILVNRLDVDDKEAIRLGQYTASDMESGGEARIKAQNTVKKMGDKFKDFTRQLFETDSEDASVSELIDKNGIPVLKWMNRLGFISNSEYDYATRGGKLTAEAKNDINNILKQRLFEGEAETLRQMFDNLPAKAQKAILANYLRDLNVPEGAQLLGDIRQAIAAYNDLMSVEQFANAGENIAKAKAGIKDWLLMKDAFSSVENKDKYSEFALELAAHMRTATQKGLGKIFDDYYTLVGEDKGAHMDDMFSEAPNEILGKRDAINKLFNIDITKNDNRVQTSDVVAGNSEPSTAGERGREEGTASGERAEAREQPADSGRGTESNGAEGESAVSEEPKTAPEQAKEVVETSNAWGAQNKLVTTEKKNELLARLKEKMNRAQSGVDPELLEIGTQLAVYHVEAGAHKFADYVKALVKDLREAGFGKEQLDKLKAEFKKWYGAATMDEGLIDFEDEFDDPKAVRRMDIEDIINEIDKEVEPQKENNNGEQGTDVQAGTVEERTAGHQRNEDSEVGGSQQDEVERPQRESVGGRDTAHPSTDESGSVGVSGLSEREQGSEGEHEVKNTRNYKATTVKETGVRYNPNDYSHKSADARVKANIEAIRVMQELQDSGETATKEQMDTMAKFSGWGGLGIQSHKDEVIAAIGEEEYEKAALSANSSYYTPDAVINTMWDVARKLGFKGGNILEGSAGIGNIIALMPEDISGRSNIHAVELDNTTGGLLKQLYPDAKVDIQGFQDTKVDNNSVDLAITNVPFVTGLRTFDKTGDKDLSTKFKDIHDFCIAKNIRKLKEGGLGIFITSSATLDNSTSLRQWITGDGRADVIGAFRMNDETFGGTGATSDIIVVRKRTNNEVSPNAIDVSHVIGTRNVDYPTGKIVKGEEQWATKPITINKYFAEHPENMGGEMKLGWEAHDTFRPASQRLVDTGVQEKRMREWLNGIKEEQMSAPKETVEQAVAKINERLGEGVREGSMLLNKQGQLCVARRGEAVPLEGKSLEQKIKGKYTKQECFKDYSGIKTSLQELLDYETKNEGDEELGALMAKLNRTYDRFVKKYGQISGSRSLSFLKNDADFANIMGLENTKTIIGADGKKKLVAEKGDIFSKRVVTKDVEPQPKDEKDGVIASIYKFGKVDTKYIADKLGKSEEETKKEIIDQGLGFEDPTTNDVVVNFDYLSGNVREKLQIAKDNNADGRYDKNIKDLEKVMPMDIPAHLIDFNIGSNWVNPKLFVDFIKEKTGCTPELANAGGSWAMSDATHSATLENRNFGVYSKTFDKYILGTKLIEAAMRNTTISVQESHTEGYGADRHTVTVTDKDATQACQTRINEIRADFREWAKDKMREDKELANEIEKTYNDKFNNYVPKQIPDSFVPEHFGGATHEITLLPHQAKAAIRATMQPVLLAHEPGTGKTYTQITIAMEMRRLGTAKKPMIVVQNATTGQFVSSAKELYPTAKILTIDDTSKGEAGRKDFYAKIRYNDWDMIIVPQSVLDMMPDSYERQMQYISDKIEEKKHVLEAMSNDDGNGGIVARNTKKEISTLEEQLAELTTKKKEKDDKRAAKAAENVNARMQELLDRNIDDVEDFDEMGIDAIIVDEAHEYKHLGFATAMQRGVKGVDPSPSKKSQGLYLKCQAVLEKSNDKNVVFATGTPISNTAAETWTFMRYLMPEDMMDEYGIYYFDDFVRNFGNITQMLEFATSGKFKENTRFAGYVNLPELVRIWGSIADTVLSKDQPAVQAALPHTVEGGNKATQVTLMQSKQLRSVMSYVRSQLEAFENMSGKEKKENSHIPLVMYGIASKAAIDPRLVLNDTTIDIPESKTNESVKNILKELEEGKEYKGTTALFCDSYQNKNSGFNIYNEIKRKLVEAGVSENEIYIMKSGLSTKKKEEIFEKVNNGDIRVIMGSTQTLGIGVNMQERLMSIHNLDVPNRPMDYKQRIARLVRQGNLHKVWNKPVRIWNYAVEDSLDVTAYQRLQTKGNIADSIMNGGDLLKNNQENRTIEEEEDNFGDVVANLSGSQFALLKQKAERDLRKYENKYKQWESDQIYIHNHLPEMESKKANSQYHADEIQSALDKIESKVKDGKVSKITIGKHEFAGADSMEEFFKDYNKKQNEKVDEIRKAAEGGMIQSADSKLTVNFDGLNFEIRTKVTGVLGVGATKASTKREMSYICEELGFKDPQPVKGGYLKNAIHEICDDILSGNDLREWKENAENNIERYDKEIESMRSRQGKPFEYKAELEDAQKKLDEYTEQMKAEMAEKEAKYAEMDKEAGEVTLEDLNTSMDEDEEEGGDTDDLRFRTADENIEHEREVLQEFKEGKTKTVYRAMQVIDGKLYPPMAARVGGELVDGAMPGDVLVADEHPEQIKMVNGKPKFILDKGVKDATGKKATNVPAAYNPYWHTSNSPMNDQFKSAWIRPNMVVVECEIPESELTSGYKAEYAKDAVGMVPWKSGSVTGELVKQGHPGREVYLSRYCKIGRVLSDAETAQKMKEFIGDKDVEIPENVVTPKVKAELEKIGVKIGAPENGVNKNEQIAEAQEKGLDVDNSLRYRVIKAEDVMQGWHGSSQYFDEFDTDFAYSGAGSEAYGHGVYVSGDKARGVDYASIAADKNHDRTIYEPARKWLAKYPTFDSYKADHVDATQREYDMEKKVKLRESGRVLYEVNIPKDNGKNYLDWNGKVNKDTIAKLADVATDDATKDNYTQKQVLDYWNTEEGKRQWERFTYGEIYNNLKSNFFDGDEVKTSEFFAKAGFDGIKVKAGTMVKTGNTEGYNYVVFDADKVKIVDRSRFRVHGGGDATNDYGVKVAEKAQKVLDAMDNGGKVVMNEADLDETGRKALKHNPNATGWYNTKTGEVTVYLPNCRSEHEVMKTIWHEKIGHEGMRKALGEEGYKRFYNNLWMAMTPEERSVVTGKAQRRGWDYNVAMDEHLAEMAEDFDHENNHYTLWQKIKDVFNLAVYKLTGHKASFTINDVRTAMWLSKHAEENKTGSIDYRLRKAAFEAKLRNVKHKELTTADGWKWEKSQPRAADKDAALAEKDKMLSDYLFRRMTDAEREQIKNGMTPKVRNDIETYNKRFKDWSYAWSEAYGDRLKAARVLMETITGKKGNEIPDNYNIANNLEALASKNLQAQKKLDKEQIKPLFDKVNELQTYFDGKDANERYSNFEAYVYAKHALERNRYLAVKKAYNTMVETGDDAKIAEADQMVKDFNTERARLKGLLDNGDISLREYYEGLDAEINKHFKYDAAHMDMAGLSDVDSEVFKKLQFSTGTKGEYDEDAVMNYVMDSESKMGAKNTKDLWERVNNLSKSNTEREYNAGLHSKKTKDLLDGMFYWYVPLRGFDEKTAEEQYGYFNNNALGAFQSNVHTAGRISMAETPIATLCAMSDYSVLRSNRNKAKMALWNLAADHNSNLLSEVNNWYEQRKENGEIILVPQYPELEETDTPAVIHQKLEQFEKDAIDNGWLKLNDIKTNSPYRIVRKSDMAQHFVNVMIDGKQHTLVIHGNPRAAQAINGHVKDAHIPMWDSFNRMMSGLMTSYSYTFMMRNAFRDAEYAMSSGIVGDWKENESWNRDFAKIYAGLVVGNVQSGENRGNGMLNLFRKYKSGELQKAIDEGKATQLEKYFAEFCDNGGMTGYTEMRSREHYEKEIKENINDLFKSQSSSKTAKVVKAPFKGVEKLATAWFGLAETLNEGVENHARFSAYVASRMQHRSISRAVHDAKEISVNFNRTGAGWGTKSLHTENMTAGEKINRNVAALTSSYMRHMMWFFNPAVQGMSRTYDLMKGKGWKQDIAQKGRFLATYVAMPMLANLVCNMVSQQVAQGDTDEEKKKFGDDPYSQLPDFVRRDNACLYMGHGTFVMIPIDIEQRAMNGLADVIIRKVQDKKNENSLGAEIFEQFTQITPMDLGGGGKVGYKGMLGSTIGTVTPSNLQPVIAVATNIGWTGSPVSGQRDWNKSEAEWQRVLSTTSPVLTEGAKELSIATGGSKSGVRGGAIDLNPAIIEYLASAYFGGPGKEGSEFASRMYEAMSKDEKIDMTKLPIAKAFSRSARPENAMATDKARWYKYAGDYAEISDWLRGFKSHHEVVEYNALKNSKDGKIAKVVEHYKKRIKKMQEKKNEAKTPMEKEYAGYRINENITKAMQEIDRIENSK